MKTTAIVVQGARFHVIGAGAVYVVDGSRVTSSNLAEESESQPLSIFDIKLHMLSRGDGYDLRRRRPRKLPPRFAAALRRRAGGAHHGQEPSK